MPPKGKRGIRGSRPPDEQLDPELLGLSVSALQERIARLQEGRVELSGARHDMQLDRDMASRRHEGTRQEVRQTDAELRGLDREMDELLRGHRVNLKVHGMHASHLLHERREAEHQLCLAAPAAKQRDLEDHHARLVGLACDHVDLRQSRQEQRLKCAEEAETMRAGFEKRSHERHEGCGRKLSAGGQDAWLERHAADVDQCRKTDVHAVEEIRHKRVNDLVLDHQEFMEQLKAQSIGFVRESVQQVDKEKAQIKQVQKKREYIKDMAEIPKQANDRLEKQWADVLELRQQQEEQLAALKKDRHDLNILRGCCRQRDGESEKADKNYRAMEKKLAKVERDREEIKRQGQQVIRQNDRRVDLMMNGALEMKLERLTDLAEEKQDQLVELVVAAKVEPTVSTHVSARVDKLEWRNRQIDELLFEIEGEKKAYNDTVRLCEAKLPQLGVPPGELGFDELASRSSNLPMAPRVAR